MYVFSYDSFKSLSNWWTE